MHAIIYFERDLSVEQYDSLRIQGIDMDDWDYMIVVQPGNLDRIPERMYGYTSFHDYEEYKGIHFLGGIYDIGIAYH